MGDFADKPKSTIAVACKGRGWRRNAVYCDAGGVNVAGSDDAGRHDHARGVIVPVARGVAVLDSHLVQEHMPVRGLTLSEMVVERGPRDRRQDRQDGHHGHRRM